MDFAEVLSGLFLGSFPRDIVDVSRLRRETAITAVLDLQTDEDKLSLGFDWGSLEAHYAVSGIELCRMPVRDFDTDDLRVKLPECVHRLDRLLAAGHSVYLHCTAGVNRSPTVAIAYFHWCRGLDLDEAVEYVQERRTCEPNLEAIRSARWDPPEGQGPQE